MAELAEKLEVPELVRPSLRERDPVMNLKAGESNRSGRRRARVGLQPL
jgi:hypothetical protein